MPRKIGSGELIGYLLSRFGNEVKDKLEDDDGIFALVTDFGIIVAKRYIFGNIVSCHLRAVIASINQKKPLIMYIQNTKKYYSFDAEQILKDGEENMKGDVRMWNFSIRLGIRKLMD